MNSKELIRGSLRIIVLKLLAENRSMYGYEITLQVKKLSQQEIELTFGALYPTLHKLEAEGLLTSRTSVVDGRERKYYSLTSRGTETAKVEVNDYFNFARAMNLVLGF